MADRYTFSQLEDLWVQAGGSRLTAPIAAAIAMAESGGNPGAINASNSNGTVDRGLWQINSVHGSQSTFDPLANARSAVGISKGGTDWRPWCVAWSNGRCGGTFLGPGSPVLRFLQGPVNSGSVATAGNTNAVVTNPANPLGDVLNGFFGNTLGLPTPQQIRLYVIYISMSIVGYLLFIVGIILLILSTRTVGGTVRGVARSYLFPSGPDVVVNAPQGPPGPPGRDYYPDLPAPASAPPVSAVPVTPADPFSPPSVKAPSYRPRHQMMVAPEGGLYRSGGKRRARARSAVAGKDKGLGGPDVFAVDTPGTKGYKGRHSR